MKQKPPEKTKKRCVSTDSGHTQMHSCRPARSHALIHDRLRPRALIQHTWYVQKKHNQNIKNKTQNKHQNQNQNKTKPKTKTKTNQKNTRYVRRTRHHTHALTQACEQHTPCQGLVGSTDSPGSSKRVHMHSHRLARAPTQCVRSTRKKTN